MKNLVTGATGFLGSHVVEKLLEDGQEVVAFARKTSNTDYLKKLGVEIYRGDLKDYQSVEGAMNGMDRVYHVAAVTGEWVKKKEAAETNIDGTRNMLNAALANNLDRFVFVSSLAVLGLSHHYNTGVETDYPVSNDPYIDTKIASEKLVNKFSKTGLRTTILRPGFVYGEREMKLVKRIVEKMHAGKFFFIGDGKNMLNLNYGGNFADAAVLATKTEDSVGQTYNVANNDPNLTMENFVYKLADLWELKRPTGHIPVCVAKGLTSIIEGTWRVLGKKTPPILTKTRVKFMSLNLDFDISKTEKDLGYSPKVGIDEGLKRTKEWIDTERPFDTRWLR